MDPSKDSDHADDRGDENSKLLERKNLLLEKIKETRIEHRLAVQNKIRRMRVLVDEWNHEYNDAEYQRGSLQIELGDVLHQHTHLNHRIELYSRCNVLNDCFKIWYKGKFGTINGLRLGYVDSQTNDQASNDSDRGTSSNRYISIGIDMKPIVTSTMRQVSAGASSSSQATVTWLEVNAALGIAAHLLFLLQRKQDSFIRFTSHEIMPMGSYTKIGEKQHDPKQTIWYNLFYNNEHSLSFLFSQRRIFNKALNGLGYCLADAIECAKKKDRTLVIPFPVVVSTKGILIENIPIALGNSGEEWTKVMKYFLTDLKWIVVYAAKHMDR